QICLTYLNFWSITDQIELEISNGEGMEDTEDQIAIPIPQFAFLDYTACHWGNHARKGYPLEQLDALVLEYLSMDPQNLYRSLSCLCRHIATAKNVAYDSSLAESFSAIHIATYFGIHQVILNRLLVIFNINAMDAFEHTPLLWAAENGHEA